MHDSTRARGGRGGCGHVPLVLDQLYTVFHSRYTVTTIDQRRPFEMAPTNNPSRVYIGWGESCFAVADLVLLIVGPTGVLSRCLLAVSRQSRLAQKHKSYIIPTIEITLAVILLGFNGTCGRTHVAVSNHISVHDS